MIAWPRDELGRIKSLGVLDGLEDEIVEPEPEELEAEGEDEMGKDNRPNAKKQAVEGATRVNVFRVEPEGLKLITDKAHPFYDPRVELALNEGLVASMKACGFQSVIGVWKDGDQLYVVDGLQRLKAALQANKELRAEGKEPLTVEFRLVRGEDADVFGVATTLNQNRYEDDPVEQARKAKRLLDFCKSDDRVAATMGWTKPQYRDYMKLITDLSAKVRDAVAAGNLSVTAAAKLATLPREEQDKQLADLTETGKATVKRVTKAVKKQKADVSTWRPRNEIRRVSENMKGHKLNGATLDFAVFVSWVTGDIDTSALLKEYPSLRPHFGPKEPKA